MSSELSIHLYLEGAAIFQSAALTLMVMATMKVTTTMSAAAALKNSIRKYYMNERCTLKFSEKRGGHAYMTFTSVWSGGLPQITFGVGGPYCILGQDGRDEYFENFI